MRSTSRKETVMKKFLVVVMSIAFFASAVFAAGPLQYQVTGPVLELKDDVIVVQKDNEKWAIARDKSTKVIGDLKVGSKVTVFYTMTAAKIDVKEPPKKK
jgi:hypothetical protein